MKRRRGFASWWRYWTFCAYWGCEPPDDGTWWRARYGMVVITPEVKNYCGHCGRNL